MVNGFRAAALCLRHTWVAMLVLACVACILTCCCGLAWSAEWGGLGEGAGHLHEPRGVAVDQLTGDVYVADQDNDRVDQFTGAGTFVRAWGWGVKAEAPEKAFQVCTAGTGCLKGEAGGGAGEFGEPDGIAVSATTNEVLVIDRQNNRLEAFSSEGEFLWAAGGGVNATTGANLCTRKNLEEHDVCGTAHQGEGDREFTSVGRQGAIAADVAGNVFVGDRRRVQELNDEGGFVSSFAVSPLKLGEEVNQAEALTVTAGGLVCLTVNSSSNFSQESPLTEVRCYSTAGVLEHTISLQEHARIAGSEVNIWLAATAAGTLYVDEYVVDAEATVSTFQAVLEYDEAGAEIERFPPLGGSTGSTSKRPGGVAVNEAGEELVMGFVQENVVRSARLPARGPFVESENAVTEPAGCVKLEATVIPEGAKTQYWFTYGPEPSPSNVTNAVTMSGEGFNPENVSARPCDLTPDQTYYYHVIAENANDTGKPASGAEETVKTLPAVSFANLAVADVSADSVSFEAEVNPNESETEYWFEYAPAGSSSYTATKRVDVGGGTGFVRVAAHVDGLSANTTYVFRVAAENNVGSARATIGTFLTQPSGGRGGLLDGRIWEQVSPVEKHSAAITLLTGGGVVQATPDGSGVTYYASTGSEGEEEGEEFPLSAQIVSRHGSQGWSSQDIMTPAAQRQELRGGEGGEYWLFSSNLEKAAVEPNPFTGLSIWTGERTPYVRDEASCPASDGDLQSVRQSGCFTPLLTSVEGPYKDVEGNIEYGGPNTQTIGDVNVVDATPNLSHVVLTSGAAELELLTGVDASGLFEWAQGKLSLVSVPAGGGRCGGAADLGTAGGISTLGLDWRNVLSPEGNLLVWSSTATSGPCDGHVYLRDMGRPESVMVDGVQGGSGEGKPEAIFQDASVDDSRVFFIDSQRLTANSTGTQVGVKTAAETAADLYEYAYNPETDGGMLTDMTLPVHAGEAAGVLGVLGASENGSIVYVVAKGVLSETANADGEVAVAGDDNLYVLQRGEAGWVARYVATLSGEDSKDWDAVVAAASARVSPDGRWLAFMSDRSLTGYDNHDRVSGVSDEEVFLYGTTGNRVVCVSCNPTGARPTGMLLKDEFEVGVSAPLIDREQAWNDRWVSGIIPVRYAIGLNGKMGVYQPRYLSNGGRLFFDSTDALSPQDVNGNADVYEYEPVPNSETAASDSCGAAVASYSASLGGCIDLISSGTSSDESAFLDASEDGNDVFFLTASKLDESDNDTAYDVYDAHSCGTGTSWACGGSGAVAGACGSGTSCAETNAPGGSLLAPLASEALEGEGNLKPTAGGGGPADKAVSCPHGKHRRNGRCVKNKSQKKRRSSTRKKNAKAKRSARGKRGTGAGRGHGAVIVVGRGGR